MFRKANTILLLVILFGTPSLSFITSSINNQNVFSIIQNNKNLNLESAFSSNSFVDPNNGEIWSSFSGLPGDVSCRPVVDESIIYVGTITGLTKVSILNGSMLWFVSTPGAVLSITSLTDVTNDAFNDVLITFDNQEFNNTELINGRTGEVVWSFRPTATVFVDGQGFCEQETRTWNGLQIDDITGDNNKDVVISSYNTIYALDILDGTEIWTASATDDIWSLDVTEDDLDADGISEVIFGSQDGELILVSGSTGDEIWEIQATKQ